MTTFDIEAFDDGHCPLCGIGIQAANPGVPTTTAA